MRTHDLEIEEIQTDVLVIGSEAAGGRAAIEAQEQGAQVLLVSKGLLGRSGNTPMSGGGVQAPLGHADPRDNPDAFFEDVIRGGDYLNNQKLVERLTRLSVTEIPKMEKWGARFVKRGDKFEQVQYPGSSYPRGLKVVGFHVGLQIRRAFKRRFEELGTKILEDVFVTSLLTRDGEVAGALGLSLRTGKFLLFRSKTVIMASGGCSQVYLITDSSRDATGDGMVMAYNAGAELMDMEFQQFFPICCYTPPFEMSLITASLRYRLHAKFYNSLGEPFMERYLPEAKDWGLRSVTSRAIFMENLQGRGSPHGGAYLSCAHLPENLIDDFVQRERPPFIQKLRKAGIDIRRHALEAGPAAHYSMGGIRVNENCETSVPRLYAAGEVASGMDGAERIDGGPAITWCLTMGSVAGREAAGAARKLDWLEIDKEQLFAERERVISILERKKGIRGFELRNRIKEIMWNRCSLIRDKEGLQSALAEIEGVKRDDIASLSVPGSSNIFNKGWIEALEAINMANIAEMILRSALMREESRMSHYRRDFPRKDNRNWLKNIIIKKVNGCMVLYTAPPIITRMHPPLEEEIEDGRESASKNL